MDKNADILGGVRRLNDGSQIPVLGFGVWQVADGNECVKAVRWALDAGYRHIDTAQAYGNEESVGRALRESGVPREEIYITTKFYPQNDDPVAEARKSLDRLGVDQIDLYLVHWPAGGPLRAWPGMEKALEQGLARSIGISNYSADELDAVVGAGSVVPAINQVLFNPRNLRTGLLEACARHGVEVEAYSPLGTGRLLGEATVAEVAERIGRTPAQVLLRWCVQHGLIILPKSTHEDRILANAAVFDFELADEDMAILDGLDQTGGTDGAREDKWWK